MNLDDLKDQLNDQFQGIKNQILESEIYNTLHEKYVTLPTSTQKILNFAGIATLSLLLFLFPLTFFMSSSENVEDFNVQRKVIRDLFKASKIAGMSSSTTAIKGALLTTRVQGIVSSLNLVAEQNGTATQMSPQDLSSAPNIKGIEKEGVQVTLKKLNLRQILQASSRFQTLSPSIKLVGMTINADTENDHYFNTTFKLVSYFQEVPQEPSKKEESSKGSSSKRNSRKRGK